MGQTSTMLPICGPDQTLGPSTVSLLCMMGFEPWGAGAVSSHPWALGLGPRSLALSPPRPQHIRIWSEGPGTTPYTLALGPRVPVLALPILYVLGWGPEVWHCPLQASDTEIGPWILALLPHSPVSRDQALDLVHRDWWFGSREVVVLTPPPTNFWTRLEPCRPDNMLLWARSGLWDRHPWIKPWHLMRLPQNKKKRGPLWDSLERGSRRGKRSAKKEPLKTWWKIFKTMKEVYPKIVMCNVAYVPYWRSLTE